MHCLGPKAVGIERKEDREKGKKGIHLLAVPSSLSKKSSMSVCLETSSLAAIKAGAMIEFMFDTAFDTPFPT